MARQIVVSNLYDNQSTPDSTSVALSNLTIPQGCVVLDVSTWGFIPWDNPGNLISQHTEKTVKAVVGAVCLPVLFLISVPCNILNMLVFWTQGLKERINLCLFYLSFVDLFHMFVNVVFNAERIRLPFTVSSQIGPVTEFIVDNYLLGIFYGFNWISGFITMMIGLERCLCVVSPLRSQTFLKTKTTAVILATATVLILTGAMTIGMRRSLLCVFDPATNTTSKVIYTSKLFAGNKAFNVLSFFVATLQVFVYVIVVAFTTIVTSVKLKKMVVWRNQMSSSTMSSGEMALTRMLIAVSILFLVCSTPAIISGIGVMFVPGLGFSGPYYNLMNLIITLIELGSFINSTFNFFVYCVLGSKFKETLLKLLCCKTPVSTENRRNK